MQNFQKNIQKVISLNGVLFPIKRYNQDILQIFGFHEVLGGTKFCSDTKKSGSLEKGKRTINFHNMGGFPPRF